jgi:poly(ADP-ribose) glycohydrolase
MNATTEQSESQPFGTICSQKAQVFLRPKALNNYSWGSVEVAKLRMLFNYFERCRQRQLSGDPLSRPVHTIRRRAEDSTADEWEQCRNALVPPVVHPLSKSIDEAKNILRVDFANRIVGGAAIAYGCVQEEIMFCVCPELIVTRLFCPVMKQDEAIVVIGAEQFSTPTGYGSGLEYGGAYVDSTPLREDGALGSYVVAIDALDLRGGNGKRQYEAELILRELCKAWAGFGLPSVPPEVATGNWGCGVFCGDPELKSIIQWLTASRADKVMHYFPWDNESIRSGLPKLASTLTERGVTVGEVSNFLLHGLRPKEVYAQVLTQFVG